VGRGALYLGREAATNNQEGAGRAARLHCLAQQAEYYDQEHGLETTLPSLSTPMMRDRVLTVQRIFGLANTLKTLALLAIAVFLIPSCVAQVPDRSSGPRSPENECGISGTVVKLAEDEPLRKATVQLQSLDDPDRTMAAITDGDGRFELKRIEPGKYKLRVSRAGYVVQEYGQHKPGDPGAVLSLRPAQQMKGLMFWLAPSAVIAGKILDQDGEPLASVVVSALREAYSQGKRTLSTYSTVETDDLGEYRLFGLEPGRYFVSAVYPRWARFGGNGDGSPLANLQPEGYAKMYYPGTPDQSKAIPVAVKSGEEVSSTDIFMRQVLVYHVRGHVYNQLTSKPATDINVLLIPKRTGRDWEFSDQQAQVGNKDGAFDIPKVLPGSYSLIAYWLDEGKVYSSRLPVDVGNTNVEGLNLTLGAGMIISGQVFWDGHPSMGKDELTVSLEPLDGLRFFAGGARVGPTNSFALKDVGEGSYRAELDGPSKDCYIKEVRYGQTSALDDGFTVTRETPAKLEVTISPRGARVEGSIANTDGLPATGVWVVLVPEETLRSQSRLYKAGTTDQYGRFDLRGIAPGDYKLFSWQEAEDGAWEDPEFLKPFEGQGERVSLREGDQKTVHLRAIGPENRETATP
jgi:protocatechuate 3,4-dioxygenase beta subunit